MATAIAEFREFIRLVLNDNDPDIKLFDSDQIDRAVQFKVGTGKVPGYSVSGTDVTPDLTMDDDPASYALLIYHAASMFMGAFRSESFNTRAYSERTGKPQELVDQIILSLYDLENGDKAS